MKTLPLLTTAALLLAPLLHATPPALEAGTDRAIPFDQLGAEAQKQYSGDGISITITAEGAVLRTVFQKLEGQATREGLWLSSTVEAPPKAERFRVTALNAGARQTLPPTGTVRADAEVVRFERPGLVEEYRVSLDGVRQDFIVQERPAAGGELAVDLGVTGATAETAPYGAKLTLDGSGRAIAYSRLHVTDAAGQVLAARMEVTATDRLRVVVDDAGAVYPVRIDPTFSDANWVSLNPGVPGANDTVYAMAVDGSGQVYVGGEFTFLGRIAANYIAKWDGSAWSALGTGMDARVFALKVSGGDVYAGGEFTLAGGVAANFIAKWNGSAWSPLGSGMNLPVLALAESGGSLYAGGTFTLAGGSPALRTARWDGAVWSALGTGTDELVHALAFIGGDLYAGGVFNNAGGFPASKIAKWNGAAWSALGTGMNGTVFALAASGTDLFVGGSFTTAGGSAAVRIAKWDGLLWSALGSGLNGAVQSLAVSGGDLYAGGNFTLAGGSPANYVAKWNGATWSALGTGVNNGVFALAVSGGEVFAGGDFSLAGDLAASYIAKWDGSEWDTFGTGLDARVLALAVIGGDLYAGGDFTTAGGVATAAIAKWNGSAWSALGTGMDGSVLALAAIGTDLYAGGDFTLAGGVAGTSYIAKWNGTAWSALGTGMNSGVMALAASGTDLYAGGDFTSAGGGAANRVAKWNGTAWSALGTGTDSSVRALTVSGLDLYAGGDFSMAGGAPADFIAKWNGVAWSALGTGTNNSVLALAVNNGFIYAAGDFTLAGGLGANRIGRWNGSAWSLLGSGMDGRVRTLTASGRYLYAGGDFTLAGGTAASRIALWDGSAWSALGSGLNHNVHALAAGGNGDIYAGGTFTHAGATLSPFVVQANLLSARFYVGDSVSIDLSLIPLAPGEFLRVTGLPAGLVFIPGAFPTISGTVLGLVGSRGVQIQVRSGARLVRAFPFDLAVEPFQPAGSYELLLEDGALPVGKLKVVITPPTRRSPNPAYSATLERLGEPRRSARGQFLATGFPQSLSVVFPTFRTIYPSVTFDLVLTAGQDTLTGSTDPVSSVTARGFRLALPSRIPGGNPKLTLTLPPLVAGDRTSTPAGIGHATGTVNSRALVRLRGLLGDAQTFTASLNLSQTNQAVVWLTPYRDKMSYLGGIATIGDLAVPERPASMDMAVAGLKWQRELDLRSKSYPNGFGPLDLDAATSRWYPQRKAEALSQSLGLDFRVIHLGYTAPPPDLLPMRWSLRDNSTLLSVFPTTAVPWSGRASGVAGTFTGTLKLPAPAARSLVRGVLLQDESFGSVIGRGLVKIPITGPGLVRGSFETTGIELEN